MSPSMLSCRLMLLTRRRVIPGRRGALPLREMRQTQIPCSLHLDQAAARALGVGSSRHTGVQRLDRRLSSQDELDLTIVELVDQPCKAPHAFELIWTELRHARHQDCMVAPRELDVIRGPARTVAQLCEIEPDCRLGNFARPDLPAFDLDVNVAAIRLAGDAS